MHNLYINMIPAYQPFPLCACLYLCLSPPEILLALIQPLFALLDGLSCKGDACGGDTSTEEAI